MVVRSACSSAQEQIAGTWENMDQSPKYYAEWRKSDARVSIVWFHLHDARICKTNLQKKKTQNRGFRWGLGEGFTGRGMRELPVFHILISYTCVYGCQNSVNAL